MTISKSAKRSLVLFSITIIGALFMRLLGELDIQKSALEYVALPYLLTLLVVIFVRPYDPDLKHRYALITCDSLLAFLGISIIFFEGFICVIFFLPIYFLMIGAVFFSEFLWRRYKDRDRSKILSHAFPVLILIASIEGVHPDLSVDRTNVVSVSARSTQSIQYLQDNLLSDISLPESRHWLLSVFPMPNKIEADEFHSGAIHTVSFTYKRWVFTNEHNGFMRLKIESVSDKKITIRFLDDSSYLSTYLSFEKSDFVFTENQDGTTGIRLDITFERRLDPFWYFEPLERYAMTQAANYIVDNMILKDGIE